MMMIVTRTRKTTTINRDGNGVGNPLPSREPAPL